MAPKPVNTEIKSESDSEVECLSQPKLTKAEKKGSDRSPRIKWSEDQIRQVVELRASGVKYENMRQYFPGATIASLQAIYTRHKQQLFEVFDAKKDEALKEVYLNYEKKKWENIGKLIGMSPNGCKKRVTEMNYYKTY